MMNFLRFASWQSVVEVNSTRVTLLQRHSNTYAWIGFKTTSKNRSSINNRFKFTSQFLKLYCLHPVGNKSHVYKSMITA